MSSKPKPKLHDDILILMVEKIFFQKPEGFGNNAIDLRTENPYTFFMAHKPITETAFITQFAKLRRVEFENCTTHGRIIEFHKDEEKSFVTQNELFTGPWYVSNMLLEEIIKRKKLRVTNVACRKYLKDREACDLGTNASSLEAFCILFLDTKLDIADSMKNDYDLAINQLEIDEHPKDIKKNFETILAINSKELVFDTFDEDLFSDCSSSPRSQITADKTIKIVIKSRAQVENDKFVANSMSYANFVIETCPNLTTLHFDVHSDIYDAKDYIDKLNTLLRSFMDEFLKPLDKGHSELKICLTWTGNCEPHIYEDIPQDHELLALGTKFTAEDPDMQPDTARIIKVFDAKSREHECLLRIFIDNEDMSDPNHDLYDYGMHFDDQDSYHQGYDSEYDYEDDDGYELEEY